MIEAALLTGGKSRRMGRDKSQMEVLGEPQAERIVRLLAEAGIPTTALGRAEVSGAGLLPDDDSVRGPLDALRRFEPRAELVFVLSCDLPRFDTDIVRLLAEFIGGAEAAIPFVDGFRQPLVGLYRREAFTKIVQADCPMAWLDILNVRLVDEENLLEHGVDPNVTRGANTPEEFKRLTGVDL